MNFKKVMAATLATVTACATLGFTACGGSGAPDSKTLYVYTNAGFAPYEYLSETGDVVGVDMDIMKYIGKELGYTVVINDIEFNQILTEVAGNKMAVGAAGMTKKESRDEVALASISYATSVQYVIAPVGTFDADDLTDGKLPLSKLAELGKKSIGVQAGTTGDYMVSDAIDLEDGAFYGTGMTKIDYTNAIVASQDIGKSVGAVVIDKLPAMSIANANDKLTCYELDAEPESYVLYFNKEATELVSQVNAVLEEMISSGLIDQYTLNHSGASN